MKPNLSDLKPRNGYRYSAEIKRKETTYKHALPKQESFVRWFFYGKRVQK